MAGGCRMAGMMLGATLLVAAPAVAATKAPVYRSPGYKGTKTAPKTKPPAPPKPITVGSGEKPNVLVDAAGTAHIVFNEPGGEQPDRTRYCRLKRGATACDPTTVQALVPDQPYAGGNAPQFNDDTAGPRVLALGDTLLVLSFRYPNVVGKPGGASSSTLYAWSSDDGGTTFSEPAIVGDLEPTGGAVVFGSPSDPQIGVVSDTKTGGTYFQLIRAGAYDGRQANLGSLGPDQAYSGSAGVEGTQPVVAFADLKNQIFVRRLPAGADAGDAAAWTTAAPIAGEEPRLATGPAGTFLISRPAFGKGYQVRDLTPGRAPRPVTVSPPAVSRDLIQDPSGRLIAGWVDRTKKEVVARISGDGSSFSSPQTLLKGALEPDRLDLGATADGGGFALVEQGGQILATGFGAYTPTGALGLGLRQGGGGPLPPGDQAGCTRVRFAAADITPQGGCLLPATDPGFPGAKVATAEIDLNGLKIVPEAGVKIVIDPRRRTLDTTGTVRVLLRAPGVGEVVLWRGELHVKLEVGLPLFSFDTERFAAALKGFPIKGRIDVELTQGGVRIPIALGLPKVFGDVRGDAVLLASKARGLQLDSLRIAVDQAFVGPLLLDKLRLGYEAGLDQWDGQLKVGLPPQPGGAAIDGSMRFQGGDFKEASLTFTPPYPGIAAGPGVFITYVGGGFGIDPVTITGKIGFGAIPLAAGGYTLGVDGQIKVVFADPTTFTVTGVGSLFGFAISQAEAAINTDGFFSARGSVSLDLKIVEAGGSFQGFVDGPKRLFGAEGSGMVKIVGFDVLEGKFVASTRGVGGCYEVFGAVLGFGYKWGDELPLGVDVLGPFSCDLEPYKVAAARGARAAQAGGAAFAVTAGEASHNVEVTGAGGVPSVVLVAPGGERIAPVALDAPGAATAKAIALAAPQTNRTVVGVRAPAAGTWRVEPAEGSAPITAVRTAAGRAAPKVTARVGGAGRARTLGYRISGGASGLKVSFAEVGRAGTKIIGTARGRVGALRFAPGDGPGGVRTIVALLENDGTPRSRSVVARYTAPRPRRPGRVRGVSARRSGTSLVVRWVPAPGARAHVVRVRMADGRRVLRVAGPRARQLRLPRFLTRRDRGAVTVVARSAAGRSGAASRPARLRG